jgi:hypothetical protein
MQEKILFGKKSCQAIFYLFFNDEGEGVVTIKDGNRCMAKTKECYYSAYGMAINQ